VWKDRGGDRADRKLYPGVKGVMVLKIYSKGRLLDVQSGLEPVDQLVVQKSTLYSQLTIKYKLL